MCNGEREGANMKVLYSGRGATLCAFELFSKHTATSQETSVSMDQKRQRSGNYFYI